MATIRNSPLGAGNNGCYAPGSALLRLRWKKVFLYKQTPPESKNRLIRWLPSVILRLTRWYAPWIGSSKTHLIKYYLVSNIGFCYIISSLIFDLFFQGSTLYKAKPCFLQQMTLHFKILVIQYKKEWFLSILKHHCYIF